jgi:hypothetical protein
MVVVCFTLCAAVVFSQAKRTILVSPITSNALSPEERALIADAVISRILTSANFTVISEAGRALALSEIERSQSAAFAEQTVLDVGKQIEADLVLVLGVGRIGTDKAYATLRLIDVKTGKLERAASQEFGDLDGIAERMQSLVGKTLQISGADAALPASEEVLLLTPSNFTVFESLYIGASVYTENARLHTFTTTMAHLGTYDIYGRPLGLFLDVAAVCPFWLIDNGTAQSWLFAPGFPWGVVMNVGASYLLTMNESVLVGLAGGVHLEELLFWWPLDYNSPQVIAVFGGNRYNPFVWNMGVFASMNCYILLNQTNYLLVGLGAGYDQVPLLTMASYPGFELINGWSVSLVVTLAFAK